jgi:hypothetical protein
MTSTKIDCCKSLTTGKRLQRLLVFYEFYYYNPKYDNHEFVHNLLDNKLLFRNPKLYWQSGLMDENFKRKRGNKVILSNAMMQEVYTTELENSRHRPRESLTHPESYRHIFSRIKKLVDNDNIYNRFVQTKTYHVLHKYQIKEVYIKEARDWYSIDTKKLPQYKVVKKQQPYLFTTFLVQESFITYLCSAKIQQKTIAQYIPQYIQFFKAVAEKENRSGLTMQQYVKKWIEELKAEPVIRLKPTRHDIHLYSNLSTLPIDNDKGGG